MPPSHPALAHASPIRPSFGRISIAFAVPHHSRQLCVISPESLLLIVDYPGILYLSRTTRSCKTMSIGLQTCPTVNASSRWEPEEDQPIARSLNSGGRYMDRLGCCLMATLRQCARIQGAPVSQRTSRETNVRTNSLAAASLCLGSVARSRLGFVRMLGSDETRTPPPFSYARRA